MQILKILSDLPGTYSCKNQYNYLVKGKKVFIMEFRSITERDSVSTNDTLKNKSGDLFKVIGFHVGDNGSFDFNKIIIKPYPLNYTNSTKILLDRDKLVQEGWSKKLYQRVTG